MAATGRWGAADPSLMHALRRLGASLLSLLRVRAELFGIELDEEKARLRTTAILALLAAVFLALGLQVLTLLAIVLFWDTYRLTAIAALAVLYLGIAAAMGWKIRGLWRRARPFSATLEELRKDLNVMQGHNEPGA
jgi:uncharacterized membrane protein YqjE